MKPNKQWNKVVRTGLLEGLQLCMVHSGPAKISDAMLDVLAYAECLFRDDHDFLGLALVRQAREIWRSCVSENDQDEVLALAFKEIGKSLERKGYAEPAIACYLAHLTVKSRPVSFWLTPVRLPDSIRQTEFDDMARECKTARHPSIAA